MEIKCLSRSGTDLPEGLRSHPEMNLTAGTTFPLELGKCYTVYGITVFLGHVWHYICDEHFAGYPVWNPASLFTLVDNRLPSCWRVGFHGEALIIAFDEWVNDRLFYDRLTDLQADAVAVFNKWKGIIDEELRGQGPAGGSANDASGT